MEARHYCLLVAILETAVCVGPFLGWPSVALMVRKEGLYDYLCHESESDTQSRLPRYLRGASVADPLLVHSSIRGNKSVVEEKESEHVVIENQSGPAVTRLFENDSNLPAPKHLVRCDKEDLRLNLIFTVTHSAQQLSSLPLGILTDKMGPRFIAFLQLMCALGALLMGCAKNFVGRVPIDLFCVGCILMASPTYAAQSSLYHVAFLFPKRHTVVCTLLSATTGAACIIAPILFLIWSHVHPSVSAIFCVYSIVIFAALPLALMQPARAFRKGDVCRFSFSTFGFYSSSDAVSQGEVVKYSKVAVDDAESDGGAEDVTSSAYSNNKSIFGREAAAPHEIEMVQRERKYVDESPFGGVGPSEFVRTAPTGETSRETSTSTGSSSSVSLLTLKSYRDAQSDDSIPQCINTEYEVLTKSVTPTDKHSVNDNNAAVVPVPPVTPSTESQTPLAVINFRTLLTTVEDGDEEEVKLHGESVDGDEEYDDDDDDFHHAIQSESGMTEFPLCVEEIASDHVSASRIPVLPSSAIIVSGEDSVNTQSPRKYSFSVRSSQCSILGRYSAPESLIGESEDGGDTVDRWASRVEWSRRETARRRVGSGGRSVRRCFTPPQRKHGSLEKRVKMDGRLLNETPKSFRRIRRCTVLPARRRQVSHRKLDSTAVTVTGFAPLRAVEVFVSTADEERCNVFTPEKKDRTALCKSFVGRRTDAVNGSARRLRRFNTTTSAADSQLVKATTTNQYDCQNAMGFESTTGEGTGGNRVAIPRPPKSIWSIITSRKFLFQFSYEVLWLFIFSFYLGTVNMQLSRLAKGEEESDWWIQLYSWVMPFAFPSSFLVGTIADRWSMGRALLISATLSLTFLTFSSIPVLNLQIFTFISNAAGEETLCSLAYALLGRQFDAVYFCTLCGIIDVVFGFVNLSVNPITEYIVEKNTGFIPMQLFFFALGVGSMAFPLWLIKNERKSEDDSGSLSLEPL